MSRNFVTRGCLVCRKPLADSCGPAAPGEPHELSHPPSGAVVFTAAGNYGSAVFDPPPAGPDMLEVSVCDDCLVAAAREGLVLGVEVTRLRPVRTASPWEPS